MKPLALLAIAFAAWGFCAHLSAAPAQQIVTYVQLIHGSDTDDPPTPGAKEIGPVLEQKLRPVFKWKHYYVTQQEKVTVQRNKPSIVRLKNGRELEIQWLESERVEVSVRKDQKVICKSAHQNHPELMMIIGADAGNREPWFVVVRRSKPLEPEPSE